MISTGPETCFVASARAQTSRMGRTHSRIDHQAGHRTNLAAMLAHLYMLEVTHHGCGHNADQQPSRHGVRRCCQIRSSCLVGFIVCLPSTHLVYLATKPQSTGGLRAPGNKTASRFAAIDSNIALDPFSSYKILREAKKKNFIAMLDDNRIKRSFTYTRDVGYLRHGFKFRCRP